MKKLAFILIAMFSVALTSCSCFDSDPIEPQIIGTGNLQYVAKSGTYSVVIDSIRYTVTKVTIKDNNLRTRGVTQDVDPVEGMLVTIFKSPRQNGIQAVAGLKSAEQIEELYHTNSTVAIVMFSVLGLCIISFAFQGKTKVKTIKTDL